jgi:hypothetical protein
MERFFEVTAASSLHKEWFEYKENDRRVRERFKKFAGEQGISANEYYVADDSVFIVPTETDKEKFGNALLRPLGNGLCQFRKASKVSKAWVQGLKDADLRVISKPMLFWHFKSIQGKFQSRLFDQDGKVYCSMSPCKEDDTPEGFVELKGSEFYKVMEGKSA